MFQYNGVVDIPAAYYGNPLKRLFQRWPCWFPDFWPAESKIWDHREDGKRMTTSRSKIPREKGDLLVTLISGASNPGTRVPLSSAT